MEVKDILAEFRSYPAKMMFGDVVQELGVSLVGKKVLARLGGLSCVKILVRQIQVVFGEFCQVGFITSDR